MCQTNTGEPIALRKRGMSVDGLSKLDTTNLAARDHWHREACFQPSALHGNYGLRGPRAFARERPFSGVELCDLNFHCGSSPDLRLRSWAPQHHTRFDPNNSASAEQADESTWYLATVRRIGTKF
jgi:hypothetical protein